MAQQKALWGAQASFTIQKQSAHTTVNYFHVLGITQMLISSVWAWVIQWGKYVWLTTYKTTGHKHRRHRAVCALCPSLTSTGNPLTCQKPWLAFIHGSHSGVCAHTCMHTRVCVCRLELIIRCLPQSLHLIFETLSFPWSVSLSHLARLAGQLAPGTFLSPPHHIDPRSTLSLWLFLWVLGIKLCPSCLCGKLSTGWVTHSWTHLL